MDFIFNKLQDKYLEEYKAKINAFTVNISQNKHKATLLPPLIKHTEKNHQRKENKRIDRLDRFSKLYSGYFNKRNNIENKKQLLTINQSLNTSLDRNCTISNPHYPKSLNRIISRNYSKPKKTINIIEILDNPDEMKLFHKTNYGTFINEQRQDENIQSSVNLLMGKVEQLEYTTQSIKVQYYSTLSSKIILKVKGICLKIRDPQSTLEKKHTKIYLPFSLIPFYYSVSKEAFLLFIAKILVIPSIKDNEPLSNISLNQQEIQRYYKEITYDEKLFSEKSIFCNHKSYIECQRSRKFTWLIKNKELQFEIQPLMIELKAFITPTPTSISIIHSFDRKSSYNNNRDKQKLVIQKAISKELMVNYLRYSFNDWENSTLCYLSSFKSFRRLITYAYGRPMKSPKLLYFIDEDDETINKDTLLTYPNKSNDHNHNHDQFPKHKSNFSFFMTLKEFNYFFTFYSYGVTLQIDLFKHRKEFTFDISFEKMKFLYKLKTKYNIDDIIRKCIIVNRTNETVSCSIELLKGIAFDSMESFFDSKDELNALQATLKVSLPRIQWDEMISVYQTRLKERKVQKYILKDNIVEELLNKGRNEWLDLFAQFQDELGLVVEKKTYRTRHKLLTINMMNEAILNAEASQNEETIRAMRSKQIRTSTSVCST